MPRAATDFSQQQDPAAEERGSRGNVAQPLPTFSFSWEGETVAQEVLTVRSRRPEPAAGGTEGERAQQRRGRGGSGLRGPPGRPGAAVRRGQPRGAPRGPRKRRGPQGHGRLRRGPPAWGRCGRRGSGGGPGGSRARPPHVTPPRAGEDAHVVRVAFWPRARGCCRRRLAGRVQPPGSAESRAAKSSVCQETRDARGAGSQRPPGTPWLWREGGAWPATPRDRGRKSDWRPVALRPRGAAAWDEGPRRRDSLYSGDEPPPCTYLPTGQSKSTRVRTEGREGGSCTKKGGNEEHGPGFL